jgi:hypothetical protein
MFMRKTKPLTARRGTLVGDRLAVRPRYDEIMAVPLPAELRALADTEIKEFIKLHKDQCK